MIKKIIMLSSVAIIAIAQTQATSIGDVDKSSKDNPFYPKYLKENISKAIDVVVAEKLVQLKKEEKIKLEKLKKDNGIKDTKKEKKSKIKKYTPIPSYLEMESATKNASGKYVLKTKKGTVIQEGSSLYSGKVVSIDSDIFTIKRKEFSKNKYYLVKYEVIFN